jgi:hypothetical protein
MADEEALPCLGKTYFSDALEAKLFRPKEGGGEIAIASLNVERRLYP